MSNILIVIPKRGRPQKYKTDVERKTAMKLYQKLYRDAHKKPTGKARGRPFKFDNDADRLKSIRVSKLAYRNRNIDVIRMKEKLFKRKKRLDFLKNSLPIA